MASLKTITNLMYFTLEKMMESGILRMMNSFVAVLIVLACGLSSCEKPFVDEMSGKHAPDDANVVLHFSMSEQNGFVSRAAVDIADICSRLNLAVFDGKGTKVKIVNQMLDTADGTVSFKLAEGDYQLVVIAHNGEGNATISSTAKVTFPSNKVTDTFFYYGDFLVSAERQTYELTLTRAVSMFRMVLTDGSMPSNVSKFKFYYLGGSSTFSPAEGVGCVNSKQTELRPVSTDGIFEIYTFPHTEKDTLTKVTVTALDENDVVQKEQVFENVPVVRNQITEYAGKFFEENGGEGTAVNGYLRMTANPEWDSVNKFPF